VYESAEVLLTLLEIEESGGERAQRPAVVLRRVVSAVVLDESDRVLLVRRRGLVTNSVGWEIPNGVAPHTESGLMAAARVIVAQTGWRPRRVRHLTSFQPMPEILDAPHDVYLAQELTQVGEPGDGAAEVEWVSPARVSELVTAAQVQGASSLVGLLYLLNERAVGAR
jgi:8-oxo-dGDP phosphatase